MTVSPSYDTPARQHTLEPEAYRARVAQPADGGGLALQ